MKRGRDSWAQRPRLFPPLFVLGLVVVIALVGLILIGTSTSLLRILGLALVAVDVVVLLAALWLTLEKISDRYLRNACRGLLLLFLFGYILAVLNPGGSDIAKGLWTDIAAGSVTGFIVLFLGEYVRRKGDFGTGANGTADVAETLSKWRSSGEWLLDRGGLIAGAFAIVIALLLVLVAL